MALEVPSDLINQSQIVFREDAGLSSFDPGDQTPPSLPTVEDSISALDPSPPFLRCIQCKGKLLRGSESLICIYCGHCLAKDLPPDPIFFNSTTGYRWLLQSLNLNASERIGPLVEENRRNKGRSPAEDGKTLSELLDLVIAWRVEPEKPETGFVNKTFVRSTSLHLTKADMDKFTESLRDIVSDGSEEQPVTSNNDQSNALVDEENLSLFQNVRPPETAAISSDLSSDASSGRDTEIQSVNSTTQNEDSKTDVISSDLSGDASSRSNTEIQSVNSTTQNEDSKTAAISSDLSGDASSGRDTEIQSVNSTAQNEDSKTAAISSDLSGNASSGVDADIQSVNSRTQNEDSKSVDAFVGSEAGLSAHMEDLTIEKPTNNLEPLPSTGDNRIQDDPINKD